jgi:hypothetical protein
MHTGKPISRTQREQLIRKDTTMKTELTRSTNSSKLHTEPFKLALLAAVCAVGFSCQPVLADEIWSQSYDGFGGPNHPFAIALDSSGNAIVTGSSANANGNDDIYTAKYAAGSGQLLWSVRYDGPAGGNDYGTGVAVDTAGNVIVIGFSANGNDPNGSIGFDFYTAKYSPNGQFLWDQRGPYTQGRANWPGSWLVKRVAVDGNGDVIISGCSDQLAPCCQWNFYTAKYEGTTGNRCGSSGTWGLPVKIGPSAWRLTEPRTSL